jgi:hypothetical protein
MASYSITGYTDTTVTITVTGLVANSDTYRIFVRLNNDTSNTTVDTATVDATSSTITRTFSGLSPSTSYAVNVNVSGTWLGAKTFTTKSKQINIASWDWFASSERINFYNVLYGSLPANPEYLSRNVWNDLVNKVNELIIATNATGYGWDAGYATLNGTYVNSGESLSAVKFNSLRNNLHFIQHTGISKVNIGDPILPSYFITITNTINNVIANT